MRSVTAVTCFGLLLASAASAAHAPHVEPLYPLSIIHWNDFHARFDDINNASDHCRPERPDERCFGGYARVVTVVRRLQHERRNANPIYLNAGDNFQGTFWYTVGRWNVTAQFLNVLPADAIAIGNHEFSHRVEGLVPFLRALRSPVVACNVDASGEPQLTGLFQPSIVIRRGPQKIGIVGVTLENMSTIASTGHLRFHDAADSVRREAARLRAQQNVRIIIVLSHCGIAADYEIARTAGPDVDVIVGGHTHTLMYGGAGPVPNGERARDVYPAVVRQPESGRRVLIVQAAAFSRWVGDLRVWFDADGEVAEWSGNPVFVGETVERDPEVVVMLGPWREIVRQEGAQLLGFASATMERNDCFLRECLLGNLLADASVAAVSGSGRLRPTEEPLRICLVHVGATRNTLHEGNITLGALYEAFPYENTMDSLQLTGRHLRSVLEHAVSRSRSATKFNAPNLLQLAGLRVVFDVRRPVDDRVQDVQVVDRNNRYGPLLPDRWYDVIVPSFLVEGGDGFTQFGEFGRSHAVGAKEIDVLSAFMAAHNPLRVELTGRIRIVQ